MNTKALQAKTTHLAVHATNLFLGTGFFMCIPLLNPYLYNDLLFSAVLVERESTALKREED